MAGELPLGARATARVALLLLMVTGCLSGPADRVMDSAACGCRLVIPGGWKEVRSLHPEAQLQMQDPSAGVFALVLTEKRTHAAGYDLQGYADSTAGILERSLVNPRQRTSTGFMVGGAAAIQREVSGEFDGDPVTYLHSVVEGPERYDQILVWTASENFGELKPTFQRVVASFEGR